MEAVGSLSVSTSTGLDAVVTVPPHVVRSPGRYKKTPEILSIDYVPSSVSTNKGLLNIDDDTVWVERKNS